MSFHLIVLYRTNKRWCQAAQLTQSIAADLLAKSASNKLVIIVAPDNLNGIPVFHNGLLEALRYFQFKRPIQQVKIIALENLLTARDEVQITSKADLINISSAGQENRFLPGDISACGQIADVSARSVAINSAGCSPDADLFLFNKGEMLLLRRGR